MIAVLALALLACTIASAVYSGGETATYSLSRVRLEAEAGKGVRAARLVRDLLRDEVGLLITILIGNNLAIELASGFGEGLALRVGVPPEWMELAVTAVLTPFLFVFAELVPKDLFRRRPHALTGIYGPFLWLSRLVYWPLALPLRALLRAVERLLGVSEQELEAARGRLALLSFLAEGTAAGAIDDDAERMVQNVLELCETSVTAAMVPWSAVETLERELDPSLQFRVVARSSYTRLPVVERFGPQRARRVCGYVHQLDVLGAGQDVPVLDSVRPLLELPPATTIDRALTKLRSSGRRAALVGTAEAPQGLLTLKDLVEEISGDLDHW